MKNVIKIILFVLCNQFLYASKLPDLSQKQSTQENYKLLRKLSLKKQQTNKHIFIRRVIIPRKKEFKIIHNINMLMRKISNSSIEEL